jgi:hypothetical protein
VEWTTVPGTGADQVEVVYEDGHRVTYPGPFSEAKELADRTGLTHMEPGRHGSTR